MNCKTFVLSDLDIVLRCIDYMTFDWSDPLNRKKEMNIKNTNMKIKLKK